MNNNTNSTMTRNKSLRCIKNLDTVKKHVQTNIVTLFKKTMVNSLQLA